ncbi:MAG: hypothetical protein LBI29_04120 [Rickettsiales bacterium]|jgi:hypothetical protein|nr:hypothetical protein [Rickettsiales bacterium]
MKKRIFIAILFLIIAAADSRAYIESDDIKIMYIDAEPVIPLYLLEYMMESIVLDGRFENGENLIRYIRDGQDVVDHGQGTRWFNPEDFVKYIGNGYKKLYGQSNVDIKFYNWNPEKAKNVYHDTIYGIFENFFSLPLAAVRNSSIDLIDTIRRNVGHSMWLGAHYNDIRDSGSDGSDTLDFSFGVELLDGTTRGIGTRIMSFLSYRQYLSDETSIDRSPPYYKYSQKIQDFRGAQLGLYVRSTMTKAFSLDYAAHLGFSTYKGASSIHFILPKDMASGDEFFSEVEKRTTAPVTIARRKSERLIHDIEDPETNIVETTVSLKDSENGTKVVELWMLDAGLGLGAIYSFELPGGAMAKPNLYANFLHISDFGGQWFNFRESSRMAHVFDFVPGLELNFNPARLVEVNLSFRYRKPIWQHLSMKSSFEFEISLNSMNGYHGISLKYSWENLRNSTLGFSLNYRF